MATVTSAEQQVGTSLDELVETFKQWRASKTNPATPIPDALWHPLFALAKRYPVSKLCAFLGINAKQYQRKHEQLHPCQPVQESSVSHDKAEVTFCRVDRGKTLPKVAPMTTVNTLVVECCRADGQILKIHTTNECIDTVMKGFYAGQYDASDNT